MRKILNILLFGALVTLAACNHPGNDPGTPAVPGQPDVKTVS